MTAVRFREKGEHIKRDQGLVPESQDQILALTVLYLPYSLDSVRAVDGHSRVREFFIDNLLVRVHFIIVMIRWTGLAPWEFKFPFPGSLTSTFRSRCRQKQQMKAMIESAIRNGRGGLVFEAHRLLHHSTLGLRVIKKKKKKPMIESTISNG